MGLAAPKNRMKLSNDPNNTKWTNDTEGFGHKIMTSQGWAPGQYLGAKDAKHAEFHTAANASHIRVSIKDDNLGLGAKIGSGVGHGECTGLDAFKNLLGRLNGKEESEIEKEQKSREYLKRAIYTERRWGSVRFVPGGFLIGDKIQHLIDGEAERIRKLTLGETADSTSNSSDSSSESEEEPPEPVEKTKKSKKRKIEAVETETPEVVAVKIKTSKRKRKVDVAQDDEADAEAVLKAAKKAAKKEGKAKELAATESFPEETSSEERKRRKREKREKKEKKKERSTSDSHAEDKASRKKKKPKRDKEVDEKSEESSKPSTKESTPATPATIETSGRSAPLMGGRHAVRARNIAQKRLASMDVASLNQIFMIKS